MPTSSCAAVLRAVNLGTREYLLIVFARRDLLFTSCELDLLEMFVCLIGFFLGRFYGGLEFLAHHLPAQCLFWADRAPGLGGSEL